MANRSYLYAIDFDRTQGERKRGEKIYGLSEYPYSIPISYKILVSQEPEISHSINWEYEHPIAIQGNFDKGKQKLIGFLKLVKNKGFFDKEELETQIVGTQVFLDKYKLKNIILECGEIYELGADELENQNKQLFQQDILNIETQIEECLKKLKKMKLDIENFNNEIDKLSKKTGVFKKFLLPNNSIKIQELEKRVNNIKKSMWNTLGISHWSNILYYHFENE